MNREESIKIIEKDLASALKEVKEAETPKRATKSKPTAKSTKRKTTVPKTNQITKPNIKTKQAAKSNVTKTKKSK